MSSNTTNIVILILGIICFIGGIGLRYWVNRRRFNRRNFAGMETFRSYEHAKGTGFVEGLLKLIGFIVLMGGVLLILTFWYSQHLKKSYQEKVQNSHRSK